MNKKRIVVFAVFVLIMFFSMTFAGGTPYNVPAPNNNNENVVNTTKSSNAYLQSLTIDGYELGPKFDKDRFEYTITVSSKINDVYIDAKTEALYSIIEITGGEDLVEGQNVVEIKVTAEDGTEQIYILNINKEAEGEETNKIESAENLEEDEKSNATTIILVSSGIAVLAGGGVAIYKTKFADKK